MRKYGEVFSFIFDPPKYQIFPISYWRQTKKKKNTIVKPMVRSGSIKPLYHLNVKRIYGLTLT